MGSTSVRLRHKCTPYPSQHLAMIDQVLCDQVQRFNCRCKTMSKRREDDRGQAAQACQPDCSMTRLAISLLHPTPKGGTTLSLLCLALPYPR